MSSVVEINWKPDQRTLRQFGYIALAGFGLLALLAWKEAMVFSFGLGDARMTVTAIFAGLGVFSALASLVAPVLNKPVYLALTVLSYPIGFVMSYVIMGTLFYLVIGPIALALRLTGRDSMHRKYDPSARSYWVKVVTPQDKTKYFRQS